MGGEKTIWLVGLMGAGKSRVGPLLAARLGLPFLDSDAEVERAAGAAVAAIFAREGEAGFRARERAAVEALAERPAVIALGGGAFCQPGLRERIAASGTVIYLRAAAETLAARVGEAEERPLLAGLDAAGRLERLRGLLAERASSYEHAQIVVDTDDAEPEQVVERALARLRGRS